MWTLRDGKLVRGVDFGDRADALEAAGLSEDENRVAIEEGSAR
jgi:hypothetical protein